MRGIEQKDQETRGNQRYYHAGRDVNNFITHNITHTTSPKKHKDTNSLSLFNTRQVIKTFDKSSAKELVLAGVVIIIALVVYKKRDSIELTNSSKINLLILLTLLSCLFIVYKKFNLYKSIKINFNTPVMNVNYVHRESSRKLYSLLDDPSKILPIIFYGQGGEGKTEMVLNYIHNHHKGDVYWFNSENSTILKEYIHLFLVRNSYLQDGSATDEDIGVAFNEWRKAVPNNLCVFDNLVFSDQIRNWLAYPDRINPPAQAKIICIVSSDSNCFSENGFSVIAIEKMLPEESRKLLETHSGIACENELEQTNQLIAELDNLPLVIVAAGNYIKQNNYSYESFLEFFQENKIIVLQQRPNERHVSAWVMFYAHFKELSEKQKILLQYASCLSQNNIARSLLRDIARRPVDEINKDLLMLQQRGLLQPDDKNHFKMHAIFRDILQLKIIEDENLHVKLLTRIYEVLNNKLDGGTIQLFLPHVNSLADLTNRGVIRNQSKSVIKIFDDVFYLYSMAHHHNSSQDKKNTYSVFSGVNIAMRGVKISGKVGKIVSKQVINLSEKLIDVKKIPFRKDSFRANVAIAFLQLPTSEKISTYLLYKEIVDSLETGLSAEISNRQLNLFKAHFLLFRIHILPLPGAAEYFKDQLHYIYTTTKKELEMYKKKLITDFEFFEESEEIILINSFLATVYREVGIRLDSENEIICELEKSIKLFENVILSMKSYNISDDYILLVEIKLELATTWKRLLHILYKKIADQREVSVENLTSYEEIKELYNSTFSHNFSRLKLALPKSSDLIVKFNAIYAEKLHSLDEAKSINGLSL